MIEWCSERRELAGLAATNALPPVLPGEVAYLLFTSGSTGDSQGCASHPCQRAPLHRRDDGSVTRSNADDRFSQTFDQTFDLSVFDLFVAWERGACVYACSRWS